MTERVLAAGRYALGERVGSGGMADVFLARDTRLERDVAIKLFRPGTTDGIERGSAEARLLAGLNHPGLVRVLDMHAGETEFDPAYLVMEYIAGPDLGDVLRDGPLDEATVRQVGFDLARALHHIHSRGVIHRDIKPSNILTRDVDPGSGMFTYLLTDFGIARLFDGSRMTSTGLVVGSAAYFSPEQARGDDVGAPGDIYALGLVLIECATGERAFPGTGVESALARLHRSPSIPTWLRPQFADLLTSMTLDLPEDRPDARDVAQLLSEIEPGGAGTAALPAGLEAPTRAFALPEHSGAAPPTTALPPGPAGRPTVHEENSEPGVNPHAGTLDLPATATHRPVRVRSGSAGRNQRWRPGARAAMVAGVVLALLLIVGGFLLFGGAGAPDSAEPEPLPAVPGVTGERLQQLYESVQP